MDAASDRPEFEPPPQPGLWRGYGLAILAHLLLILALTWGLRWKSDSSELAAEAELWSAVPQQAAPKAEPTPAPPPPPPKPVVREQPPPPPAPREADIALEREKKRKEAEAREAREKREALAREREKQKQLEAQRKQQELEKQKELQAKLEAEKRRKEEEARKERERQKQEEARLAKLREENLKRIQAMAGGTGAPGSTGVAARASGPSAGWAARVRARVKPNIVFTDAVSGNPEARVEVRLAPDGTIVGKRIIKSSGHQGWDDAVLRALDRTEVLPRDEDGRVPTPVELIFRPKDLG